MGAAHTRMRFVRIAKIAAPYVALVVLVLLFLFRQSVTRVVEYAIEDWRFASNPSAQLAFEIGTRHLDSSSRPGAYDIDRAEYYFRQAVNKDPHLPYIYHQLARVEFLRGNFEAAMGYINIQIDNQGDNTPNSYYVRGLIEGFMGNYVSSSEDYAYFLKFDPEDWAAMNDYAWVLLKDNRPAEAATVTERGLQLFPDNPWLLNSNAIASYEIGDIATAKARVERALRAVQDVSNAEWSHSYPGNDPAIAGQGVASFKQAVEANFKMITAATSTNQ